MRCFRIGERATWEDEHREPLRADFEASLYGVYFGGSSLEAHALRWASQRDNHTLNEVHLASSLGSFFYCHDDKEQAAANREASTICTNNAILEHKQFEKK